jgi:hypothetical protein
MTPTLDGLADYFLGAVYLGGIDKTRAKGKALL